MEVDNHEMEGEREMSRLKSTVDGRKTKELSGLIQQLVTVVDGSITLEPVKELLEIVFELDGTWSFFFRLFFLRHHKAAFRGGRC